MPRFNQKKPESTAGWISDDLASLNSQYTVLIVDDDSINRIVLKGVLNKHGYTVLVAEDGKQAVELFDQSRPDIVLMDIMMPEMDGYEATRIIKEKTEDTYVPILFLTATADQNSFLQCVEAGGDDVLSKPYNPLILRAKVEALLRTKQIYKVKQKQNEELSRQEQMMQSDLDVADRILSKISTKKALDIGNINYHMSPMEKLNGDIIFVENKPDGGQHFLLGDFTGHGLGAAIGGLVVFDVFKSMTLKGFPVTQIISEINSKLSELLPVGRFLAVGIVELDVDHKVARIWNCGLPDIYHLREGTGVEKRIISSNLPLGILSDNDLDPVSDFLVLNKGDRIFIYSDGVTEAENSASEMYGSKKLMQKLDKKKISEHLIPDIIADIRDHTGDLPQSDDISILEVIIDPGLVNKTSLQSRVDKKNIPATTWSMSFSVQVDAIKKIKVIPSILQMMVDIQGLQAERQSLYLILNELYISAVDQGLLALDKSQKLSPSGIQAYDIDKKQALKNLKNGNITLNFHHEPCENGGKISLSISHDGDGFDIESMHELDVEKDLKELKNPKGMQLVKTLCEDVKFEDFGRSVAVEYIWKEEVD